MVFQDSGPTKFGRQLRESPLFLFWNRMSSSQFTTLFRKGGFATIQQNNFSKGSEKLYPFLNVLFPGLSVRGIGNLGAITLRALDFCLLSSCPERNNLLSQRSLGSNTGFIVLNVMSLGKLFIFSDFFLTYRTELMAVLTGCSHRVMRSDIYKSPCTVCLIPRICLFHIHHCSLNYHSSSEGTLQSCTFSQKTKNLQPVINVKVGYSWDRGQRRDQRKKELRLGQRFSLNKELNF